MGAGAAKFNFNSKRAQSDARINAYGKNSNLNKLNGYDGHLGKYSNYSLNIKETK